MMNPKKDFGTKSHHCELCGKGFVTQGRLMRHTKAIHHEASPSRKVKEEESPNSPISNGKLDPLAVR